MKKRSYILISFIVSSMLISGCGNTMPNLTEEQSALISEYAAGLLLKYDSRPNRRLLSDAELAIAEKAEQATAAKLLKRQQAAEAAGTATKETQVESTPQTEATSQTEVAATQPTGTNTITNLSEFLGKNGFDITYSGYDLVSSYPPENREDVYMLVEAASGKQLLILKLNVTNQSSEAAQFDMFDYSCQYGLQINGEAEIPSEMTLLMDDFSTYKGNIEAGASEAMVLLFEIDSATAESISQMNLVLLNTSGTGTLPLTQN